MVKQRKLLVGIQRRKKCKSTAVHLNKNSAFNCGSNKKSILGTGLKNCSKKRIKQGGVLKGPQNTRRVKNKKTRVIPVPKTGGFLPLLIPLLGALGAAGSGIARAINNAKTNRKLLEEQKRHDLAMEQKNQGNTSLPSVKKGLGLYIKPYQKNYR